MNSAKRFKYNDTAGQELEQSLLDHHGLEEDSFWETARLFTVLEDDGNGQGRSQRRSSPKRKRVQESSGMSGHVEHLVWVKKLKTLTKTFKEEAARVNGSNRSMAVEELLPGSLPSSRSPEDRVVELSISNPFIMGELAEHPRLTSVSEPVIIPKHVQANGLVKFRLQFNDPNMPQKTKDVLAKHQRTFNDNRTNKAGDVSYLPRDFGRGLNLDEMDMRLLKFYLVAFCAGRTLLEQSNVWLKGVPAIAEKSECVKHAMLSLSAGYVLDYAPSPKLKKRANHHHRRAVMLLGLELNKPENYELGKEEPLLMALSLLNHEDIVNWETREATKKMPKWYQGNRAVKYLLDKSDPGYRYRDPINVQSSVNRYIMSHYQMKSLILSETCSPLEPGAEESVFPWLLEGNEKEVRRITGLAGCCAKVLHMFAQITQLCAQLHDNPESQAVQTAGEILLERLHNFQQWSDLMEVPFETSEQLFEACEADLDEIGKVKTAHLSVALNAESFVQAAQAYLLCRLFRRSRRHPEVQKRLIALIKCTNYVPLEGPLYTAQDSLYGLAMAGLLAVEEEHREIVRGQFAPLEMGPRGNDTPVWRVLERLWCWLDEGPIDPEEGDKPLAKRTAWWEQMVSHIMVTEGRLSLL